MNLPTWRNWRTWEPNPIVVKELRQAVRSWAITGVLMLFLTGMFVATCTFLVGESLSINRSQALGRDIFGALLPILAFTCLVFIPVYTGGRFSAERLENNVDLLYITALSPARIIRGKLICGVYLTILFFSVCLPFLVFTTLLRGVDLPTIFVLMAGLFLLVVFAVQLAIFIAALPASKGLKILITVPVLFFSLSLFGGMTFTAFELMRSGIGSRLNTWAFWSVALSMVGVGGFMFGFLHLASIAAISAPSANRARALRCYATLTWFLGGLLALCWGLKGSISYSLAGWVTITLTFLVAALLVSVCEGDELSLRIRRTIPAAGWRRLLAFLFFSGSASGLAWTVILWALTCTLSMFLIPVLPLLLPGAGLAMLGFGGVSMSEFLAVNNTIFLYALGYALFALFLHRRFQPHRPAIFAGLLAVALATLWAILPNLFMFSLNQFTWDSLQHRQLGNIFNVLSLKNRSLVYDHLVCASALAAIAMVLNLRWFLARVRDFNPQPPADAIAPPSLAPPPLPK